MTTPDLHSFFDLLGRQVRDRVTGLEGVCDAISFDLYGCIQAVIAPRIDKDGKHAPGRWLDIHRIEAKDGPRIMTVRAFDEVPRKLDMLGRDVRDRITGFEGILASIAFELYGYVKGVANPRVDKDGKIPDGLWMDLTRYEVVGEARAMPVPEFAISSQPKYGATPQQHTHGPAEKPAL